MPCKMIVIGASAGGLASLKILCGQLPPTLDAAVFVTLHIAPDVPSLLPTILSRAGPLAAHHPADAEPIQRGRIYVAPPDSHLLLRSNQIHLARGPRENGARPAIDPMFRSAARIYGKRVIGILLSGTLDDGAAGLGAIKAAGGVTIAQEPADALFGEMPRNAIDAGVVDHVVPLVKMGVVIERLVKPDLEAARACDENDVSSSGEAGKNGAPEEGEGLANSIDEVMASDNPPREATDFTCPDCGGVLRVVDGGKVIHYRCHVGHAWSTDSLRAAQVEKVEESLWVALRTLEENRKLMRRLLDETGNRGLTSLAKHYQERLHYIDYHAGRIRDLLTHPLSGPAEAAPVAGTHKTASEDAV